MTWTGSRSSRTAGISTSRTSRPARRLGWSRMCRGLTRSIGQGGPVRKDEFAYDAERDTVLCPGGQRLHFYSSSVLRGLKKINYVNKQACRDWPAASAMHEQQLSIRIPHRERGSARPDAVPAGSAARSSRATPRGGGASTWHDQTMDEPRRFPDAGSRKGPG